MSSPRFNDKSRLYKAGFSTGYNCLHCKTLFYNSNRALPVEEQFCSEGCVRSHILKEVNYGEDALFI